VDWAVFERLFEISPEARAHAAAMMNERDDSVRATDMARIGAYLDELIPYLTPPDGRPIAYLDTGCGVGHSLRAGLARGLVVQGVEVDDVAVALARKAGLSVALPAEVDGMPRGPYQLLTFWETLEHITDPLATLQRFVPFLADDGLVAITVPNLNAPATRIMREACAWVHGGYNTPGHVNLFHVHALDRLLARAGLALVDAEGQFGGNPEELLAFIGGESRGAFDVLEPPINRGRLPAFLGPFLTNVSPGMALIEQYTLASPILRVVACHQGQESRFSAIASMRQAARTKRLADEARWLLSFEPDARQLQAEIDRRDDLLREKEAYFQGEIQRRDQAFSELRGTWERSLSFKVGRLVSKLKGRG
jgi:hypothetical protein